MNSKFGKIVTSTVLCAIMASTMNAALAGQEQYNKIFDHQTIETIYKSAENLENGKMKRDDFRSEVSGVVNKMVKTLKDQKLLTGDVGDIQVKPKIAYHMPDKGKLLMFAGEDTIELEITTDNDAVLLGNKGVTENKSVEQNAKKTQFLILHELGHIQHSKMKENFKSSHLNENQNQAMQTQLANAKSTVDEARKSGADDHVEMDLANYNYSLGESYADAYASMAFLKLNQFSKDSIDFLKEVENIRADNSKWEMQRAEASQKGVVFKYVNGAKIDQTIKHVDPYPTSDVIGAVIQKAQDLKNTPNEKIAEVSLELASNNVLKMAHGNANSGKPFLDGKYEQLNAPIEQQAKNSMFELLGSLKEGEKINFNFGHVTPSLQSTTGYKIR